MISKLTRASIIMAARLLASTALLATFILSGINTAQAATINFDDIQVPATSVAENILIYADILNGNQYINSGIQFSADEGSDLWIARSGEANTPINVLYASDYMGLLANSRIIIDFVTPGTTDPTTTKAISFQVIDPTDDPYDASGLWSAEIFDIQGNLLDSYSNTTPKALVNFSRPNADIHRLIFTPSYDLEAIDTLKYGADVPEPISLLSLSTGCLTLLLRRKR